MRGRALAHAHVPYMQAVEVLAAASWLPGVSGAAAWTLLHACLPLRAQVHALVGAATLHQAAAPPQPLLPRHYMRLS